MSKDADEPDVIFFGSIDTRWTGRVCGKCSVSVPRASRRVIGYGMCLVSLGMLRRMTESMFDDLRKRRPGCDLITSKALVRSLATRTIEAILGSRVLASRTVRVTYSGYDMPSYHSYFAVPVGAVIQCHVPAGRVRAAVAATPGAKKE